MVRRTSLETLRDIEASGLLSVRRMQVYKALFEYGPCTANELFKKWKFTSHVTQQNIHPRLGELREVGVVDEITERPCEVTGRTAIVWDVNDKLPTKFDKPKIHKCKACNGTGVIKTAPQARLFD